MTSEQRPCSNCGVPLSRYNTESMCSACGRELDTGNPADNGGVLAPLLPEAARNDPDLRRAVSAQDWMKVLQSAATAGVRQGQIAQASGLSQSAVSRLATGHIRAPGLATIRALCDALGIPRRWAGLTDPEEDTTDRRQLLTLAALGTLTAPLAGHTTASEDPALATDDAADEAALLGAGTAALRRLEQRTPTRHLVSAAGAHAQLVASTRAQARPGRDAARLAAHEAEAAGLVAWLHVDLDETERAKRYYRAAIKAAELTQNPMLVIYMRASLADYATSMGSPGPALTLLRQCRQDLPRNAPDIAWAWLDATAAVTLAAAHQPDAEQHLRAASQRLHGDTAEPVWPWLMRFDDVKLARYEARNASAAGDNATAAQLWAITDRTTGKQGALNTAAHARALAGIGDVEQSVELACRAWDAAQSLGSYRVQRNIRALHASLPPSQTLHPLEEQLNAAW